MIKHHRKKRYPSSGRLLWHFDGKGTNWRLNVSSKTSSNYYESKRHSDLNNHKLMHYIQLGTLYSDIAAQEHKIEETDKRRSVVKWIIAFAVFWIIFYFVEL